MKQTHFLSLVGVCLLAASGAMADGPAFNPPHGLVGVGFDSNNKLITLGGIESLAGKISTNAAGHTVVANNKVVLSGAGPVPGGIAERDGNNTNQLASENSTVLVADDPGFRAAGTLPEGFLVRVNFHNALRFFNGTAWTAPTSDTRLRAYDLSGIDESFRDFEDQGVPAGNLETFYTHNSSDLLGTTNLEVLGVDGLHAHLGYELSRTTPGEKPEVGVYMIEVTLSASEVVGSSGLVLQDSDPIFILFNNDPDISGPLESHFDAALAAAQALPEPTTAMMVVAVGTAILGLRRRAA